MRLTFHSSLVLIAMMTLPEGTQSIRLGSISGTRSPSHASVMNLSQCGDDDDIPDYAALSQAWNESRAEKPSTDQKANDTLAAAKSEAKKQKM